MNRCSGRLRALVVLGAAGVLAAVAACDRDGAGARGEPSPRAPASSGDARPLLDGLRATFPAAARELSGPRVAGGVKRARVDVPRSANGSVRVADLASDVAVAFRLLGARDVAASRAGDVVVFRDALPGAHVMHVARADGVEDFVAFDARPAEEALAYAVDVSGVAGLRLVGRQLEMLDANGAPRLRIAPPLTIDAQGRQVDADLTIAGCAVDRDPRPPWGRAIVPPGASSCEVRVRWASATYPLLVDPAWTTTGALAQKRRRHAAVTLPAGQAFAIGGTAFLSTETNTPLASTELYDAASGTWGAGAPLPVARVGHQAVVLPDGRVVVAGGETVVNAAQGPTATTVFYAPATAQWSDGPDMVVSMTDFNAVLLGNGKVLATDTIAQELDPAGAGAWTKTGDVTLDTVGYVLAASPPAIGKALVSGGDRATFVNHVYETAYIVYDAGSRTWTKATNTMKAARARHLGVPLPNGNLLVAGGTNGGTQPEQSAEIYDWTLDVWTAAGTMSEGRTQASAVLLANGIVLIAGGAGTGTDLFDVTTGAWSLGGDMSTGRFNFPFITLPSGQALAIGGDGSATEVLASTEIFGVAGGKACGADGQCLSGHCVDGVCCDGACNGDCVACTAALKGGGVDGACEPVKAHLDPRARCGAALPATCGASGAGCDGAGKCVLYDATVECAAQKCAAGVQTKSFCDGLGDCKASTSNCGAYACASDACKSDCAGDAECAEGYVCDTGSRACVSVTRCASDHEQQNPDGTTTDCGAYRCAGVACLAQCASVDDCRTGSVCDPSGRCVQPPTNAAADSGGCSVERAPARGRGEPWLVASAAIALAFAGALRRRRRR